MTALVYVWYITGIIVGVLAATISSFGLYALSSLGVLFVAALITMKLDN